MPFFFSVEMESPYVTYAPYVIKIYCMLLHLSLPVEMTIILCSLSRGFLGKLEWSKLPMQPQQLSPVGVEWDFSLFSLHQQNSGFLFL